MGEKKTLVDTGGYRPGRSVIKRREIRLKPSSIKSLYIGRIIAPENGFFSATTAVDLYHVAPGQHTARCRQDDLLLHVLAGEGYSIIEGKKYEWERGDTIHIKPGYWHEHWNTSQKQAVNMLAARSTPLLNHFKAHGAMVTQEDETFTPIAHYVPDHPFGLGKQEPVGESDKERLARPSASWLKTQREAWAQRLREARTIMKGKDVRWESEGDHAGEFSAMLAAQSLGFDTRILSLGIQAIAPGGCNETHRHSEAVIYILAGTGYALIDGERYDLEAGDSVFIHYGQWHKLGSTSGPNGPLFTQIRILPSELIHYIFPFPFCQTEEAPGVPDFDPGYVPEMPW